MGRKTIAQLQKEVTVLTKQRDAARRDADGIGRLRNKVEELTLKLQHRSGQLELAYDTLEQIASNPRVLGRHAVAKAQRAVAEVQQRGL